MDFGPILNRGGSAFKPPLFSCGQMFWKRFRSQLVSNWAPHGSFWNHFVIYWQPLDNFSYVSGHCDMHFTISRNAKRKSQTKQPLIDLASNPHQLWIDRKSVLDLFSIGSGSKLNRPWILISVVQVSSQQGNNYVPCRTNKCIMKFYFAPS